MENAHDIGADTLLYKLLTLKQAMTNNAYISDDNLNSHVCAGVIDHNIKIFRAFRVEMSRYS
jgi:hypothetical protein